MSSSESESEIEENSSDGQENDYEEMNELLGNLAPYDYEPEQAISSEERDSSDYESSSDSSDSSENENEDLQLGRVGNKEWCNCDQCKREIRDVDSLCCTEVAAIVEEKFEGKKCVTLAKEFELLCLNKTILKNVLVGLHETRGDFLEQNMDVQNRSLRFAAYKQFIWWIFQHLGKGNRRVIPSCVVWSIRKHFPAANGNYTRFKEGERD